MCRIKPDPTQSDARCEGCGLKIKVYIANRVLDPMKADMLKYFLLHDKADDSHLISIVKS